MNQLLLQYSYLQILDLLTTLAFLVRGVEEGNPLVRFAISASHGVVPGLVMVKAVAFLLGLYCWKMGKERLLGKINLLFALVVAWNLVAMIRGTAA